jgi:hypothetical protein
MQTEIKTTENNQIAGVRLFAKHLNAPDFVIADMVLTLDDLYIWAKNNPTSTTEYNGKKQVKLQILRSKDGAPYAKLNTYKPNAATPVAAPQSPINTKDSDLPF